MKHGCSFLSFHLKVISSLQWLSPSYIVYPKVLAEVPTSQALFSTSCVSVSAFHALGYPLYPLQSKFPRNWIVWLPDRTLPGIRCRPWTEILETLDKRLIFVSWSSEPCRVFGPEPMTELINLSNKNFEKIKYYKAATINFALLLLCETS